MIIVATKGISKAYGADPVLEDINIEIHSGTRVGIVGPNGAGKTTLFKILHGSEVPDQGEIFRAKGSKWAYLPQSPQYPMGWTGYDVIRSAFQRLCEIAESMRELELAMSSPSEDALGQEQLFKKYQLLQDEFERLNGYEMDATMSKVEEGLRISETVLSTPFEQLSGGEKTKIGLAKLLCEESDVLLLDEPTNHLDVESMEWLEQFLREYTGVVMIISHDRYFLDAVVTQVYEVDGGEVSFYYGTYSDFVKEKEERLLRQFAEYQEQQKKIKKMREAIKRLKEWANQANPPSETLHRRAKNMEKALERMEKVERPRMEADRMGLAFQKVDRSGQDVIVAEGLHKTIAGKELFVNANLSLRYGERKALLGVNGCGKSTFIKMLLGEIQPDEGVVRIGSSVKIGYLSQLALEGDPERRVIEAFREIAMVTEAEARHLLAKFLFYGEHVFKKIGSLSGGERMRLRLAQLMHQEINLLILDEPTNHLDIEARETLEEALLHYRGSLFIVSHDRYFLQKTVDGVFWIDERQMIRYQGTYEEAREKRKLAKETKVPIKAQIEKKEEAKSVVNLQEKPKDEKKINTFKLVQIEKQITEWEGKREELRNRLTSGEENYQQLMEWQAEADICEKEIERLYVVWYSLQG